MLEDLHLALTNYYPNTISSFVHENLLVEGLPVETDQPSSRDGTEVDQ